MSRNFGSLLAGVHIQIRRIPIRFAWEHHLPGTVDSDSHTAFELGHALLILPEFHDAPSLKAALVQSKARVRLSSPWVHLTPRYAAWVKNR